MGLLDDAIREHLELKRRRGADPDEVARQEDEALGPRAAGSSPSPPARDGSRAGRRSRAAEADGARAPEPTTPAGAGTPRAGGRRARRSTPRSRGSTTSREPEAGRRRARSTDAGAAARASAGDEDVLEETPEFLEETPEHDRLWFEQKPPKDFDFDS